MVATVEFAWTVSTGLSLVPCLLSLPTQHTLQSRGHCV